ncbi:nuclear transcription regulator (nucleomorph) [Lotharella oceanica]|uniref:Nuclear transcription regulator n=2 Tax=Lotharella oceanica TaxID=641309 RepID=A0A060DH72_9EUKA|nr:nuclear transcription regulator [Lotharella oceanica]
MKKINIIEKKFINKIIKIFTKRFKLILKNNEKFHYKIIFWKIHRLHWEKNRFISDLRYKQKIISNNSMLNLYCNNHIDKELFKLWKKKGYEIICSVIALGNTRSSSSKNTSNCRIPLLLRINKIKVEPDPVIGCISCVSGDSMNGKPLWWNSELASF